MEQFDYRNYWRKRHADFDSIESSGIKTIGVKGNEYVYKMLAKQYKKALDVIDADKLKTYIECGFGDGFFLDFVKKNYPNLEISGLDISEDAKKKAEKIIEDAKLYVHDITDELALKKKYDIVQCFDVLYHILDDKSYAKTISNMADISDKYIMLHEPFYKTSPLLASRHVHLRPANYTEQLLNGKGFFLYKETPTHFMARRKFIYRLNRFIPQILYKIDDAISNMHPSTQTNLAGYRIKVYKKA